MIKIYSIYTEKMGVMTETKTTLWILLLVPFLLLGCTRDLDMGVLYNPSFSQENNSYPLNDDGTYTLTLPSRSVIQDHLEIENASSYELTNGTLTITPKFKETVTVKHLGVTIAVIPYPKPLVIANDGTSRFAIYFSGHTNVIVEYVNSANALITQTVKSTNSVPLLTASRMKSSTSAGSGGITSLKGTLTPLNLTNIGSNKISIYGSYQGIHFADTVLDIDQWGDYSPESLVAFFYGNNSIATLHSNNSPNLKSTKDLSYMFLSAVNFNSNIEDWNVSNVKEMEAIFNGANSFNQPLNNWDISGVENLQYAFSSAEAFNQPLDKWNTSSVKNLAYTFQDAYGFNQDINTWDTSKVTDMTALFNGARVFNQSLDKWNTENVTNMSSMFRGASAFNQPVTFNSAKVTNLAYMFADTSVFNSNVSLNTESVTNMAYMFSNATGFNQTLNLNTPNVTNMQGMFSYATTFNNNLQILNLDTQNVTNMSAMFYGATKFNQELQFDTSSVTNMASMFYYASSFNKPLVFNTSNVTNMNSMFKNAGKFSQNIQAWNVSNVTDCLNFNSSSLLTAALYPLFAQCQVQSN